MHIVIFETTHFEAAYPLIRLFDVPGNHISVFCEEETCRQLQWMLKDDHTRFHWHTPSPQSNRRHFIRQLSNYCQTRQVDWLWLNTVSDNFLHFAALPHQLPGLRMTVTLHVLNSYVHPLPGLSLRRLVRCYGKKKMRARFREYNVLSPLLLPFAQQHLPAGVQVHTIPGAVFEEANYISAPAGTPLHLVVPGSVDARRRDYMQVYQLLQQAEAAGLPLHITLLGQPVPASHDLVQRFRQHRGSYTTVTCFDTHVHQQEYDRILQSAHFIFHPSVQHTILEDGAEETYGVTVYSGNFSDAIRHARPLLVPAGLTTDTRLQSSILQYADIPALLDNLIQLHEHPRQMERWQQHALEVARLFTTDAISRQNPGLFFPGNQG